MTYFVLISILGSKYNCYFCVVDENKDGEQLTNLLKVDSCILRGSLEE